MPCPGLGPPLGPAAGTLLDAASDKAGGGAREAGAACVAGWPRPSLPLLPEWLELLELLELLDLPELLLSS